MPESPEVEHTAQQIRSLCMGRTLREIKIHRGRYKNHGPPANYRAFCADLPQKLVDVKKKGKVTVLCFIKGWYVISKLGLTGCWHAADHPPVWQKVAPNVEWVFGGGGQSLMYTDPLSYGTLTFTKEDPDAPRGALGRLAPDILTPTLTTRVLLKRVYALSRARKSKPMEEILMDQEAIVSGIGNYLKAEVLYDAKISPHRLVSDVSDDEWKQVLRSARQIAKRMVKVVALDNMDIYARQMRVYRRTTDPKGNPVVTHRTKDNRTTFWVPAVQT